MTTTDMLADMNESLIRRDVVTLTQIKADVAAYLAARAANRGRRLAVYAVSTAPRSPSFYDRFRRSDGTFDMSAIKAADGVEVE
jgi:hypothetical protein